MIVIVFAAISKVGLTQEPNGIHTASPRWGEIRLVSPLDGMCIWWTPSIGRATRSQFRERYAPTVALTLLSATYTLPTLL